MQLARRILAPLTIISLLFSLSLLGAFVLFNVLKSGGEGKYQDFSIEGALVGFVVIFLLLSQFFLRLQRRRPGEVELELNLVPPAGENKLGLAKAVAYYQRVPGKEFKRTPLLEVYGKYHVRVPSVLFDEDIRVWVQTDDGWRSTDPVRSMVRHLALNKSEPPEPAPDG